MRERINRLAKGIVDTQIPEMNIFPQALDEQIPADRKSVV